MHKKDNLCTYCSETIILSCKFSFTKQNKPIMCMIHTYAYVAII